MNIPYNMKVEITEEGIVFCDQLPCSNWYTIDTVCPNCPLDKALDKLLQFQIHRAENE